jgi:hypothetical protein
VIKSTKNINKLFLFSKNIPDTRNITYRNFANSLFILLCLNYNFTIYEYINMWLFVPSFYTKLLLPWCNVIFPALFLISKDGKIRNFHVLLCSHTHIGTLINTKLTVSYEPSLLLETICPVKLCCTVHF